MRDEDYILKVKTESGKDLSISVIDIINSAIYNKEYIVYSIIGDDENIFASVLIEKENSFELDTIPTQEEYEFINKEIDKMDLESLKGENK